MTKNTDFKAKMKAISSDTHQLHTTPLHHITIYNHNKKYSIQQCRHLANLAHVTNAWPLRWLSGQSVRLTIEWSRVRILRRPFGNFGNFLYPTLPVSFGRDTKSRWSLLSGVYARGSKRSHQSALEMCTVVDSTTHSNPPPPAISLTH